MRYAAMALPAAFACVLSAAGPATAAEPEAAAGRLVAERSCGGCHNVGSGPSSARDAPPFSELYRRYPAGGVDQILQEGMIAPLDPPDEGRPAGHPRMPQVDLGPDELSALKAYLRSLEPRR